MNQAGRGQGQRQGSGGQGQGRGQGLRSGGQGLGQGQDTGGITDTGFGLGPGGDCYCPNCQHREPHQRGVPCYNRKCPKCGTPMTRT